MLQYSLKNLSNYLKAYFNYSEDINLPVFLDYEIWKISYMLAQNIPGQEHSLDSDHGMINFVTGRNNIEERVEKQNCYENTYDLTDNCFGNFEIIEC